MLGPCLSVAMELVKKKATLSRPITSFTLWLGSFPGLLMCVPGATGLFIGVSAAGEGAEPSSDILS